MVRSRQRQRQLARAKWERQRARRSAHAARSRRLGIAFGVAFALVAGAALVWLVLHLGKTEDNRKNQQLNPTTSVPTSPVSSVTLSGSSGPHPTTASTRSTASQGAP